MTVCSRFGFKNHQISQGCEELRIFAHECKMEVVFYARHLKHHKFCRMIIIRSISNLFIYLYFALH